ncbi:MAG TPA: hypothetical protein PKW66_29080 [Polyangiaceae bacterium]|nr:hypothetical protein [Polyangiaceae bacterium]
MNKSNNPFIEHRVVRANDMRTLDVLKVHRDMAHRVFVGEGEHGPELHWRTARRLKGYRNWYPHTMQVKFAEARRGEAVVGKRACFGHGVLFGLGRNCYLSGAVIDVFLNTFGAAMEDGTNDGQYFTELEQRIDDWKKWRPYTYCEERFSDTALINIVEKARIRAVAYHGTEAMGWTPVESVKWWLDFTVGVSKDFLVWKRAPVRGGPNAVKVGDPVSGMFVDPVDRVVTISGAMFLISDVMHYMRHDRFPWEPVGTESPWKVEVEEVNWDD